jgi:HTH-type transcriptional regulator, transcriptional repressor of NAD biosynthesis genes
MYRRSSICQLGPPEPKYIVEVEVNLPEPEGPRERRETVARVCLIGAESTGKTTLAAALAEHYRTLWVPEYGAPYHHVGRGDPHREWTSEEFTHIARIRDWLEEFLAGYANRVLFCDTDTFVTAVFHEVYLGRRSTELEEEALEAKYGLYLLCDVDTPFHRDHWGLRREDARRAMHERYLGYLRSGDSPWLALEGSPDERRAAAIAAVDRLLGG